MYAWFARVLSIDGGKSVKRLMNPEWCTICDARLFPPSSSGSIIVVGASSVGEGGPWLTCPSGMLIADGEALRLPPPLKPKGKGDWPDVPLPAEPFSRFDSDDAEPLRFGLGGMRPDFCADSLDGWEARGEGV